MIHLLILCTIHVVLQIRELLPLCTSLLRYLSFRDIKKKEMKVAFISSTFELGKENSSLINLDVFPLLLVK